MAARDFLERNGLSGLIQLVVEDNKVQFYGCNCFSFYDRLRRQTLIAAVGSFIVGFGSMDPSFASGKSQ